MSTQAPLPPSAGNALLVRTDFSSGSAWDDLIRVVGTASADGFLAGIDLVDDIEFAGAEWKELREAAVASDSRGAVLFVADSYALASPDFPILVVNLIPDGGAFRCVASELWSPENNLNVGNMSWAEFVSALDENGVFRGFQPSVGDARPPRSEPSPSPRPMPMPMPLS